MSNEFVFELDEDDDLTEWNSGTYTDNYNTFDEWLELVNSRQGVSPYFKIPYSEWVNDYLKEVHQKTNEEVKDLLRCLLAPINRNMDNKMYETYKSLKIMNESIESNNKEKEMLAFYCSSFEKNESIRRVEKGHYAWEGLTWILELLPDRPYKAIEVLKDYWSAELNIMPDDRIIGVEQCIEIILWKFINYEVPAKKLLELKPREFEILIEQLYKSMGYKTILTKETRDGGKDIIAEIDRYDGREEVYIECKLYKTSKLNNTMVNSFCNILSNNKANRGMIFCTGYVSEKLKKIDKRIQILTYEEIIFLLNAHLGSNWLENLPYIVGREKFHKKYKGGIK